MQLQDIEWIMEAMVCKAQTSQNWGWVFSNKGRMVENQFRIMELLIGYLRFLVEIRDFYFVSI